MSKKTKQPRMTYRQRTQAEIEFGDDAVCGYLRLFYRTGDRLTGKCSLDGRRCSYDMPSDTLECQRYKNFFDRRPEC